jgi:hypothetical protein
MTRSKPSSSILLNLLLPVIGAGVLLACQERLAAPADCPNLCPGGYRIRDTIIVPLPHQDSSFQGYVLSGQGQSLRVSYQFPASEDRAIVRFVVRPDSYAVKTDSFLPYTLDSVALSLTVAYRDTTVKNLFVYLYRLPATIDSSFTFAQAEAAFTPANIVDSLPMADTLVTARLRTVLKGADLDRVKIDSADAGVLALGMQIRAAQGTGVRIGSLGTSAPNFLSFATVKTGDTTSLATTFNEGPGFERFVSQTAPSFDPSVLTVGGVPSARTIMRFPWPTYLRDSVVLLRVTLELVPTAPIRGLRGDTAFIQARPLLADLGGKSPTASDPFYLAVAPLQMDQTDTLRLEIRRAATLWQGATPRPPGLILQIFPEASSFSRATFGSDSLRTPGLAPRLRVTYAVRFPFEAP